MNVRPRSVVLRIPSRPRPCQLSLSLAPRREATNLASAPSEDIGAGLHCVGISHRTAAADLRQRAAISGPRLREALAAARRDRRIERLVIVSTCHRTELYAELPPESVEADAILLHWWADLSGVSESELAPHSYSLSGTDVARHLFRVAAGLDSVVLGEAQIVAQVATALRQSIAVHAASPLIKLAFRRAVRSGERARGAVWGRLQAASLGSAAVDAAAAAANGLGGKRVVIVGAGEIAELALRSLAAHVPARVTISNRSEDAARRLATHFCAHICDLESLGEELQHADVVIAATRSMLPLISRSMVRSTIELRAGRRLTIVDVSLPRNVDASVRDIAGAQLIAIDDLGPYIAGSNNERRAVVPSVEAIVDQEIVDFCARLERRVAAAARPARLTA